MNGKDLPIWAVMPQVLAPLQERRNVVVVAPTGSGKTTQVPQAIVDCGISGNKVVLVVEPRRVACRAAARRVAEERGIKAGEVGYIVRWEHRLSVSTRLCFLTEGMLLRFLEHDALLPWASVVIFDEFHERSSLADVALGIVRRAQQRRPELKLAVMSATLETELVAEYLHASVIRAEGRMFPVKVEHLAVQFRERTLPRAIARAIVRFHGGQEAGDILVFLPGKAEIRATAQELRQEQWSKHLVGVTVLPLHGELPDLHQDRAFLPAKGRKVILATNVAETSVTIPGVRYVVDSGLERRMFYNPIAAMSALTLTTCSPDFRTPLKPSPFSVKFPLF